MSSFFIYHISVYCWSGCSNPFFFLLQSLMIAAIPNIIGWLAISFAKVRYSTWSILYGASIIYIDMYVLISPFLWPYQYVSGSFFSIHGKIVGRLWCGNNLLCGNVQFLKSSLVTVIDYTEILKTKCFRFLLFGVFRFLYILLRLHLRIWEGV